MPFKNHGPGREMDEWSQKVYEIMNEMRTRIFFEYRASGTWQPRVNLYATRDEYALCVDLAGLDPEDLSVECVDERRLRLSGERRRPCGAMEGPFSVEAMEIDEGQFAREVEFPEPIEISAVSIRYDRGYLWITLRKTKTS